MPAVVLTVVPIWIAGLAAGGSPRGSADAPATAASSSRESRALKVLGRWDRERAAAWRHADPVALAALYTSGSRTGRRDVTDLERWRRRGIRVAGLRQQVSSVRRASSTGSELVLVVTDRTVGGVGVGRGRRTQLPDSVWTTHRIRLRPSSAGWRVVEARIEPPS